MRLLRGAQQGCERMIFFASEIKVIVMKII
jgi:hypothetical protein